MGLAKAQRGAKKQAEKAAAAAQDVDSGPHRLPGAAFTESQLKPLAAAAVTALMLSFVLAGGPSRVLHAADLHGWVSRPALPIDGARALLVIGTMGSGTTQRAHELRSLGLEVGHEASDSREVRCRDATVSWAHGMRFLGEGLTAAQRDSVVSTLCRGPRFSSWSTTMFDGSPRCPRSNLGQQGKTYVYWNECWAAECRRVAAPPGPTPDPDLTGPHPDPHPSQPSP